MVMVAWLFDEEGAADAGHCSETLDYIGFPACKPEQVGRSKGGRQ